MFYVIILLSLISTKFSRGDYLLNVTECGLTKGCWMMPPGCENFNSDSLQCDSIVSWMSRDSSDVVVVEIDSKISDIPEPYLGKYAAMAFSYDDKMGEDSVLECVSKSNGHSAAYLSFNDETKNFRLYQSGGTYEGRIYCKATRTLLPDNAISQGEKFKLFDLTKSNRFTLLFARGSTKPGESHEIGLHHMLDGPLFPWVSVEDMNPREVKIIKHYSMKHYDIPRSVQYILVKVHGVATLFAWWFFGAIGLLLARFYKPTWSGKKLLGSAVWFQLHRAFMVILLILQSLGFIVIFIQAGDFKMCSYVCDNHDYALKVHTILGVTCMAAVLINPIGGLLRPSPTDPRRPYFNWAHWFVGMGSWIIATVTIFLSIDLGKNGLKKNFKFVPTALMAVYIVSFILTTVGLEMISAYRLSLFGKSSK